MGIDTPTSSSTVKTETAAATPTYCYTHAGCKGDPFDFGGQIKAGELVAFTKEKCFEYKDAKGHSPTVAFKEGANGRCVEKSGTCFERPCDRQSTHSKIDDHMKPSECFALHKGVSWTDAKANDWNSKTKTCVEKMGTCHKNICKNLTGYAEKTPDNGKGFTPAQCEEKDSLSWTRFSKSSHKPIHEVKCTHVKTLGQCYDSFDCKGDKLGKPDSFNDCEARGVKGSGHKIVPASWQDAHGEGKCFAIQPEDTKHEMGTCYQGVDNCSQKDSWEKGTAVKVPISFDDCKAFWKGGNSLSWLSKKSGRCYKFQPDAKKALDANAQAAHDDATHDDSYVAYAGDFDGADAADAPDAFDEGDAAPAAADEAAFHVALDAAADGLAHLL